eukprot:3118785-Rhodomonas_salina.1
MILNDRCRFACLKQYPLSTRCTTKPIDSTAANAIDSAAGLACTCSRAPPAAAPGPTSSPLCQRPSTLTPRYPRRSLLGTPGYLSRHPRRLTESLDDARTTCYC